MSMSAMSETDVESDVDIDGMPYSPSLTAVTCHSPPPGEWSPLALAKKGMKGVGVIPVLELDGGCESDADVGVKGMDKGVVERDELEENGPMDISQEVEKGEGTSAGRRDELAEEVHEEDESEKGVVDDGDNDKSVDVRLNSEAVGDGNAAEDVVDSGYSSLSSSINGFSSAKFQLDQSRLWNRRRRGGGGALLSSVPSESQEACSSNTAEVASLEGNVPLKILSYFN
jgi:hypothetical protein